jgi:hypothetical protein
MKDYSPEGTHVPGAAGVPIVAGDGRAWRFATRAKGLGPVIVAGRVRSVRELVREAYPFSRAVAALADVNEAYASGDEGKLAVALMALAHARLIGCHCLTDAQATEVLTFGDPGSFDRFAAQICRTIDGPAPAPADDDLSPIPLADESAEPTEGAEPVVYETVL